MITAGRVIPRSEAGEPSAEVTAHSSTQAPRVEWSGMWRASALYSVAGALGKVGALVTVPFVTRALGRSDYGLLDLATALVALATMIGGFSAELPAARFASAEPGRRRQVLATYVSTVTLLSLVIAVSLAAAASFVAKSIWQAPDAAPLVVISAGAIVLTAIQVASWNVHRLHARAGTYAVLSIIDMTLKVSLILVVVALGGRVSSIVIAYVAVAAVGAGLGLWTIRHDLGWPISRSLMPRLLAKGAPFTVTAVAFVVAGYGVRGIVAEAGSTSAVGEMAIGLRVASVLALPLAAFQFAWAPIGITADQSASSRHAFFGSIFRLITVGGLAAVAVSALSPEVIGIVAGSEFSAGADAVSGLTMATVLNTAFFMVAVASSAAEMSMWAVAMTALGGGALQVIATATLATALPEMAAVSVGAALGNAAALGTLLVLLRGHAVEHWRLIVAATGVAVAVTLIMQVLLTSGAPPIVRWPVGLGAGILMALLLARRARSTTETQPEASATPSQQ